MSELVRTVETMLRVYNRNSLLDAREGAQGMSQRCLLVLPQACTGASLCLLPFPAKLIRSKNDVVCIC